jgi:hypothetical protein
MALVRSRSVEATHIEVNQHGLFTIKGFVCMVATSLFGLGDLIHRRQQQAQFPLNVVGDEFLALP